MLKYKITADSTTVVRPPDTTDPLVGKVSMLVIFTNDQNVDSAEQLFEVDSLDPTVIDEALRVATMEYNTKTAIITEQQGFSDDLDGLTVGADVEFDDDGTQGTGVISGIVWNDNDQDGIRGEEDGIQGVTVELKLLVDDALIQTTTSTADGTYVFNDVENGEYYVEFTAPFPYHITAQDQGEDDTVDSDVNIGTGKTASFVFEADSTVTGLDCGMYLLATISGVVWDDTDHDGVRDGGESGLDAVTLELYDDGDVLVDTVITDGDGLYSFAEVVAGDYYVKATTLSGYGFTLQDQGADDAVDSDMDSNGETAIFSITNGQQKTGIDCGLYLLPASISGVVWYDTDEDGIRDGGENFVEGVTVELYNDINILLDTTTTDVNGAYTFTNIPAELSYYVVVHGPASYEMTLQNQGADDTIDSDFAITAGSSGATSIIIPTGGQTITGVDCGIVQLFGTISGYIYTDTDGDGVQDEGEPDAHAGTTISIESEAFGNFSPSIGLNGIFSQEVPIGSDYVVTINPPYGSFVTDGTSPVDPVVVTDNADTDLGSFGLHAQRGSVTMTVFTDDGAGGGTAGNGTQDGTEINGFVAGAHLHVTYANGGSVDSGAPNVITGIMTVETLTNAAAGVITVELVIEQVGNHVTGGNAINTPVTVADGADTDLGTRGIAAD